MTVTFDDSGAAGGGVTTSNSTPTDVPGIVITIADKTVTTIEAEFFAVRQTTSNPLAYATKLVYSYSLVTGVATPMTGVPTTVYEHGDPTMSGALVVIGGGVTLKPQVTGLAVTTFDWRVKIRITTLSSI